MLIDRMGEGLALKGWKSNCNFHSLLPNLLENLRNSAEQNMRKQHFFLRPLDQNAMWCVYEVMPFPPNRREPCITHGQSYTHLEDGGGGLRHPQTHMQHCQGSWGGTFKLRAAFGGQAKLPQPALMCLVNAPYAMPQYAMVVQSLLPRSAICCTRVEEEATK